LEVLAKDDLSDFLVRFGISSCSRHELIMISIIKLSILISVSVKYYYWELVSVSVKYCYWELVSVSVWLSVLVMVSELILVSVSVSVSVSVFVSVLLVLVLVLKILLEQMFKTNVVKVNVVKKYC